MLTPSIGLCGDAVDHRGLWQADRVQDGRGDVDDVVVLAADLALRGDPLRPGDDRAIGDAAVAGVELRLGERGVVGDRPAGGRRHQECVHRSRRGGRVDPAESRAPG